MTVTQTLNNVLPEEKNNKEKAGSHLCSRFCPDRTCCSLVLLMVACQQLHCSSRGESQPFMVETWVEQGCNIVPTLLQLQIFPCCLQIPATWYSKFAQKRWLVNRFKSKTKLSVMKLQCADDENAFVQSEQELQLGSIAFYSVEVQHLLNSNPFRCLIKSN